MPSEFARLARSRCSDCGATDIVWTTAVDLPWRAHPGAVPEKPAAGDDAAQHRQALEERKRMWQAINWCGPDAEAWWCDHCHGWGVFSDAERLL